MKGTSMPQGGTDVHLRRESSGTASRRSLLATRLLLISSEDRETAEKQKYRATTKYRDRLQLTENKQTTDVTDLCGLKGDVVTRIERGTLRWFGHLERINESRQITQIYRANVCDEKVARVALENSMQTILLAY
ncbi:hypothetical protein EVAR_89696_1 [Eumeta japonica]|uniref:Uncharacterized protein n=1 Tax=Eumeta variegata TaxID=151549 RepID=A0A4C1WWY9_EUMVA|nr:hypothetical protein EVAR_89696_1 [Eumeta japonica]